MGEPSGGGGYEVPGDVKMTVLSEAIYKGVRAMMDDTGYYQEDSPETIKDDGKGTHTVEFLRGEEYEIIVRKKVV